ncbi:MAG: hypothetical protein GWN84_20640 [Gammaproteobacteria bacterium]|nr:hypothetical protein [Gammaproteobacteria bacterium]NIR85170.1 hypothetical protein [Gammaproteobacteria bacterium]NIU06219.1 hypothetical protein [Gammaproteobacteria bacterium]NIX87492.1 hypothetical protein [Gammaproteobacteria bacterium]
MSIETDETDPSLHRRATVSEQRHRATEKRLRLMETELHGPEGGDGLKTRVSKLSDDLRRLDRRVRDGFAEMRAFNNALRAADQRAAPWTWGVLGAILGALFVLAFYYIGKVLPG